MNCKPGDTAIVIKTPDQSVQVHGAIVCVREQVMVGDVPCWTYDRMPLRGRHERGSWTWHELPDAWLRPLRDPGEDARDETLEWLPVPATKEVA